MYRTQYEIKTKVKSLLEAEAQGTLESNPYGAGGLAYLVSLLTRDDQRALGVRAVRECVYPSEGIMRYDFSESLRAVCGMYMAKNYTDSEIRYVIERLRAMVWAIEIQQLIELYMDESKYMVDGAPFVLACCQYMSINHTVLHTKEFIRMSGGVVEEDPDTDVDVQAALAEEELADQMAAAAGQA